MCRLRVGLTVLLLALPARLVADTPTPTFPPNHRACPDRNGDGRCGVGVVGRTPAWLSQLQWRLVEANPICNWTAATLTSPEAVAQQQATNGTCTSGGGTVLRGSDGFVDVVFYDALAPDDFELASDAPREGVCWGSQAGCRLDIDGGFVGSWASNVHAKCIAGLAYRTPCVPARFGTPTPCPDDPGDGSYCQPWVFADGEAGVNVTGCASGTCQQQTTTAWVMQNAQAFVTAARGRGAVPVLLLRRLPAQTDPTYQALAHLRTLLHAYVNENDSTAQPLALVDLQSWDEGEEAEAIDACVANLAVNEQPELEQGTWPRQLCSGQRIPRPLEFTPWPTRTLTGTVTPTETRTRTPTRTRTSTPPPASTATETFTPTRTATATDTPTPPLAGSTATATATGGPPPVPSRTLSPSDECYTSGSVNGGFAQRMDDMKRIAVSLAECFRQNGGASAAACDWSYSAVRRSSPAFTANLPYDLPNGIRIADDTADRDINRKEFHAQEDKISQCSNDEWDEVFWPWVRRRAYELGRTIPPVVTIVHHDWPINNPDPGSMLPWDVFNNMWEPYYFVPALDFIVDQMRAWPFANNAECSWKAMDRFSNGLFDLWNANGNAGQKCKCETNYTVVTRSALCSGESMPTRAEWNTACRAVKELYRPLYEGARVAQGIDPSTGYVACPGDP